MPHPAVPSSIGHSILPARLAQAWASFWPAFQSLISRRKVAPVTIALLTFAGRLPFTDMTVEDAFITFRYARNIASGLGFVYNAGEHVLGTTTPLYTLVLAFSAVIGFDIIAVGKAINILADAGTAVIIYWLLRDLGAPHLAWAGVFLFVLSPLNVLYSAGGMETGLYTFLVLLTLLLASLDHARATAIAAAVLVLVRPDGLLAVGAVGALWWFQNKPAAHVVKAVMLFSTLLLPWALFSLWYFGSPIPHSIMAKATTYQTQNLFEWPAAFVERLGVANASGALFVLLLSLIGFASAFRPTASRRLRVFMVWFLLYMVAYTLARAATFSRWYYSPVLPLLFVFLCLGIQQVFEWLLGVAQTKRAVDRIPRAVYYLGLVPLWLSVTFFTLESTWQQTQAELSFQNQIAIPVSNWLLANTPGETTVCLETIGAVGWYTNRTILDEGALVTDSTRILNEQTPGMVNVAGILRTFEPEYYVAWDSWELHTLLSEPTFWSWFVQHYEEIERYADTSHGWSWLLFRHRNVDRDLGAGA